MATTALLTDATTETAGDAAEFTAPTTVIAEGTYGGCYIVIEMRVPTKGWRTIHTFSEFVSQTRNVDANGTYELRATADQVSSTTSVSVNATT